ncbi:MAG: efflux RND transporter periplasmic adaptor subunit, partial [Chloroflexota bacterium]
RIAELEAGADRAEVVGAETELAQANAALDQQRSVLATDKEQARRLVDQRANELRDVQAAYSTAFWDREFVDDNGRDPRTVTNTGLTDAQKQDFSTAFEQATLDLENAEIALAQAQVDYENAQNLEITGLADAEARVRSAQADLDELLAGAAADELAAARAQLARAEADLAGLQGSERQGAIASQQGNVANAQAQLEQLLADPTQSDLARAEAGVAQAEAQLVRAEADLDDATLRAPFTGVVGRVDVAPGETLGQDSVIALLDVERYQVILNVDEVDVARVAIDQPVEVLVDALGAPVLEGTVRNITPLASADQAVTAYEVMVEIDPAEQPVKPGMTASATIEVARQDNALSVPVQAIFTEEGETVVRVVTDADSDAPEVTIHLVETGLRAGDRQQILDGLDEGQQVLLTSDDV